MTPIAAAPPQPSRLREIASFAAAPLLSLLLYWRLPTMWFQDDDFTWVTMTRDLHDHGLAHALFAPFAQGTVRVLDRLHFLAITGLFGPQPFAYRVAGYLTWAVALTLVLLIGEKLTGSRAAGLLAALLWAANSNSSTTLVWISAYYQLLCVALLLGALYARLHTRFLLEWLCYLSAFGAMEIAPLYAVVALLCALATDRKQVRGALYLFIPAVLFTAYHFLFVPKATSGPYLLALDSRLPSTIATYLGWTFEPGSSSLRSHAERLHAPELLLGMILGLTLSFFAARCLVRKQWIAIVFLGWFAALLAPLSLLPNHVSPYYLTIPSIGLAWLAGWGIVQAWSTPGFARTAVVALAAAYFAGSAAGIDAQTRWFRLRSDRMREVVESVGAAAAAHPGDALVLEGVDDEFYHAGFDSHPFFLVGVNRVWLVPYDLSPEDEQEAVAKGHTQIIRVSSR